MSPHATFPSIIETDEVAETDLDADLEADATTGIEDIDDALTFADDDTDVALVADPVDDGREVEDFDFVALAADLTLFDIEGSMRLLDAEKLCYVSAARRAGRTATQAMGDFYNTANAGLFTRRMSIQAVIAELEGSDKADTPAQLRFNRSRRDLENMTELLVRFNYGMTKSYVRKFTSNTSREDSADFQGAALYGLMYAIDTFDPAKGRFGSWAYKPIQRAVLKAVRDADFANMTPGDFERRPEILKAYERLAGPDGNYTPTFDEVAVEAGVNPEIVARILAAPHLESIHAGVGDDGETELGDLIADTAESVEETVIAEMASDALLEYGLPVLDPRERYVLVRRYGLDGEPPEALADIGKQLVLSREAVRQIAGKALAKLLHPTVLRKLVRGGRP